MLPDNAYFHWWNADEVVPPIRSILKLLGPSGGLKCVQYRFTDGKGRVLLDLTVFIEKYLTEEQEQFVVMLCEARYAGVMRAPR